MKRLVAPGRLRWRLTVTYAIVAAIATGALALGTYVVVANARLDDSVSSSLAQARNNLVLAGTVLGASPALPEVADLVAYYASQPGFETVGLTNGQELSSSLSVGAAQISDHMQRLVRSGDLAFERVKTAKPYLVVGGRVRDTQTELYFFFSQKALRDDLAQLQTILFIGWGIVVVLTAAAGALVARGVLRPVGRASAAAHALAEGLLDTRLPVETDDEFGAWAASFNEMADALEEKIHALSESQDRERRFTSDVAHELRTPVTALATEASLLAEHIERMPPEAKRPAQLLVHDIGRLRRLVEELMEISRLDAGREDVRIEPVALDSLVARVRRARGWERTVLLDAEQVTVDTDPRRVERIVSNLIENALCHGRRDVAVRISRNGSDALVEVQDRGAGIAPEHLPHVFERFYKADPARANGGSGLGLAIALENARLLGGEIEASSEPGKGSLFTLRLPVAKQLHEGEGADTRAREDATR
jgi:two-component system sensor histidine kinase MtrB